MKALIYTLLFLVLISKTTISRTTRTSVLDGSWSTSTNWSPNAIPATNQTNGQDDIVINTNITLNGTLDVKTGTTLRITGCHTLTITGDVTFNNGSNLLVDACAVLIINGNVINNNNSNDISINGSIQVTGNYTGGVGSAVIGTGGMVITGSVSTTGTGTIFSSTVDCVSNCNNSSTNPLGSSLPIELVSFLGQCKTNYINLTWVTVSESNNDYFNVEKSRDGINWGVYTIINGGGNSSTPIMYECRDYSPSEITYYRLKQIDYDGKFTYSGIISIECVSTLRKEVIVKPNPVIKNAEFTIELNGFKDGEEVLIVIQDVFGRVFFEKVLIITKYNIVSVDEEIPAALYLIIGTNRDELYMKKVIIK